MSFGTEASPELLHSKGAQLQHRTFMIHLEVSTLPPGIPHSRERIPPKDSEYLIIE